MKNIFYSFIAGIMSTLIAAYILSKKMFKDNFSSKYSTKAKITNYTHLLLQKQYEKIIPTEEVKQPEDAQIKDNTQILMPKTDSIWFSHLLSNFYRTFKNSENFRTTLKKNFLFKLEYYKVYPVNKVLVEDIEFYDGDPTFGQMYMVTREDIKRLNKKSKRMVNSKDLEDIMKESLFKYMNDNCNANFKNNSNLNTNLNTNKIDNKIDNKNKLNDIHAEENSENKSKEIESDNLSSSNNSNNSTESKDSSSDANSDSSCGNAANKELELDFYAFEATFPPIKIIFVIEIFGSNYRFECIISEISLALCINLPTKTLKKISMSCIKPPLFKLKIRMSSYDPQKSSSYTETEFNEHFNSETLEASEVEKLDFRQFIEKNKNSEENKDDSKKKERLIARIATSLVVRPLLKKSVTYPRFFFLPVSVLVPTRVKEIPGNIGIPVERVHNLMYCIKAYNFDLNNSLNSENNNLLNLENISTEFNKNKKDKINSNYNLNYHSSANNNQEIKLNMKIRSKKVYESIINKYYQINVKNNNDEKKNIEYLICELNINRMNLQNMKQSLNLGSSSKNSGLFKQFLVRSHIKPEYLISRMFVENKEFSKKGEFGKKRKYEIDENFLKSIDISNLDTTYGISNDSNCYDLEKLPLVPTSYIFNLNPIFQSQKDIVDQEYKLKKFKSLTNKTLELKFPCLGVLKLKINETYEGRRIINGNKLLKLESVFFVNNQAVENKKMPVKHFCIHFLQNFLNLVKIQPLFKILNHRLLFVESNYNTEICIMSFEGNVCTFFLQKSFQFLYLEFEKNIIFANSHVSDTISNLNSNLNSNNDNINTDNNNDNLNSKNCIEINKNYKINVYVSSMNFFEYKSSQNLQIKFPAAIPELSLLKLMECINVLPPESRHLKISLRYETLLDILFDHTNRALLFNGVALNFNYDVKVPQKVSVNDHNIQFLSDSANIVGYQIISRKGISDIYSYSGENMKGDIFIFEIVDKKPIVYKIKKRKESLNLFIYAEHEINFSNLFSELNFNTFLILDHYFNFPFKRYSEKIAIPMTKGGIGLELISCFCNLNCNCTPDNLSYKILESEHQKKGNFDKKKQKNFIFNNNEIFDCAQEVSISLKVSSKTLLSNFNCLVSRNKKTFFVFGNNLQTNCILSLKSKSSNYRIFYKLVNLPSVFLNTTVFNCTSSFLPNIKSEYIVGAMKDYRVKWKSPYNISVSIAKNNNNKVEKIYKENCMSLCVSDNSSVALSVKNNSDVKGFGRFEFSVISKNFIK